MPDRGHKRAKVNNWVRAAPSRPLKLKAVRSRVAVGAPPWTTHRPALRKKIPAPPRDQKR